jgi:hypothetical protein
MEKTRKNLKNYEVDEVLKILGRNNEIKVIKKDINILIGSAIGNGTWGKLDFLTGYQGYTIKYLSSFKNI